MKNRVVLFCITCTLILLLPLLGSCADSDDNGNGNGSSNGNNNQETLLPEVEGIDAPLVFQAFCATCHGNDREGRVGPSLQNDISIAFLTSWVPVHRTGVDMDERLMNSLINWLYTNSTPSGEPSLTDPSRIFAYNCAVCHGADRFGGNGGPSIKPGDLNNFDNNFMTIFLSKHFSGVDLTSDRRGLLADWLLNTP